MTHCPVTARTGYENTINLGRVNSMTALSESSLSSISRATPESVLVTDISRVTGCRECVVVRDVSRVSEKRGINPENCFGPRRNSHRDYLWARGESD